MKVSIQSIIRVFLALVLIVVMTGGLVVVRRAAIRVADFPAQTAQQEVTIEIPAGASGDVIAKSLFVAKVVASAESFYRLAVQDPRAATIAPGLHQIQRHIPATVALTQLLDPKRIPNLVIVKEGAWRSEVITALISWGFIRSEIEKALKVVKVPKGFTSVEGIYFPAQYSFPTGTTALSALQSMIDRFAVEAKTTGLSTSSGKFTSAQLLTIASIAQAEGDLGDFPKITRVIFNRLKIGMPLQMDTTVHYIKKSRGRIFLSLTSTKIDSPYNTYLHYGLPPTPIGNPGRAAIEAALNPAAGEWTFFITVKPGDTRFTSSASEFNNWKNEYEKNAKAGLFK